LIFSEEGLSVYIGERIYLSVSGSRSQGKKIGEDSSAQNVVDGKKKRMIPSVEGQLF
jgi:hypothetical protein